MKERTFEIANLQREDRKENQIPMDSGQQSTALKNHNNFRIYDHTNKIGKKKKMANLSIK